MKRGLYLAPFDDVANPRLLADLARVAESAGWDGLFLWDRIAYPPRDRPVADPWVALSAIASVTHTLRLGPMITPLSRRRVHKLARRRSRWTT
jgi:alkanesulfonate monooxygenase SsuD/methylene tetrahydromethanopterin reductase-like flavin-dependent oxidoreductase (luciferase family)